MIKEKLQEFGLSEKEARVYIAALELGAATVQELARKSGVNRATTYIQVESLINRGLMSSTTKGNKSLFIVEKPQRVLEILDKRKSEVESLEKTFQKIMPDLEAIYNVKEDKPRVRFYENKAGLEIIWNQILKDRPKEIYGIIPWMIEKPDVLQNLSKKIDTFKLLYFAKENQKILPELRKMNQILIKYFPIEGFDLDITMFSNKVVINKPLTPGKGVSMSILIEDKMVYNSFVALFNLHWKMAQDMLG